MSRTRKARSRLSSSSHQNSSWKPSFDLSFSLDLQYLKSHLRYLPTLLASIPFWIAIVCILTTVSPESIRNFLIPSSYLPLLLASFGAVFFTGSFILLHSRRGMLLAFFITIMLSLHLQGVIIGPILVGSLFLAVTLLEAIMTLLERL